MIENLIAGYLSGGKRLVIPELGAFLKKDTGETVFVEFLKKDDGVFAGLIAQSLGIPEADAARQAAQFSTEVRESLAGRGFFIIPRVGTMRRDTSGNIILTATAATDEMQSVPQTPAQPVHKIVQAEPQPKVVQYTPPAQQVKVEQYTRPEPVQKAGPAIERPAAPPQVKQPQPISAEPARPKVETPRPAPVQPQQAPPVKPSLQPQPEKQQERYRPQRPPVNVQGGKKKTDMVMIIAVIAALIAIGSMVFGLLVNSDPMGNIQPTSPQTEQVATPAGDAAAETAE